MMKKKTSLVAGLLCVVALVVFLYPYSSENNHENNISYSVSSKKVIETPNVVILLTMKRSGSSIVGSIFNEKTNVTYLYEPLFPFGEQKCDEKTREDSLAVLRHISTCHFEKLPPLYESSKRFDKYAKCRKSGVCFVDGGGKASSFIERDAGICKKVSPKGHSCPSPVDPVALNKHCKHSKLIAMKVIYLCKLEWMIPLLKDPNLNVKVIHLVRDPRSTIISRLNHNISPSRINGEFHGVCDRLHEDLIVADTISSEFRNQYMRIRYEDFVLDPHGNALKIYDFVGIEMDMDVKNWIDKATSTDNPDHHLVKSDPQGMKRNGMSVLNNWRKEISFENNEKMQEKCRGVLETLQYKRYDTEKELHDLSKLHFEPI